jgi:hypothetical protein
MANVDLPLPPFWFPITTTVLHAVRKIENLAGNDSALAEEIESLKRQLQD